MKAGIVIAIVIGISALGAAYYALNIEDSEMQEIADIPTTNEPEGKNLSISLKESVGIEANP